VASKQQIQSNRGKFKQTDIAKLIADIARGVPDAVACTAVGIHKDTYREWVNTRPEFAQALAVEKQRVIQELLGVVLAGKKDPDWRAAAWLLERGYPEAFAPRPQQPPIFAQTNNYQLPEEKAKEIDARVQRLLGPDGRDHQ
jgi:hypothetical protein